MAKLSSMQTEFVKYIPEAMDDGVIYVSIPFRTVMHRCCCGCGSPVAIPVGGDGWELTIEGESVTLHPSLLNRLCQAHYWIRGNKVLWA